MNESMTPPSIVVLISGRGSNLEALIHSRVGPHIRLVLSNRPQAAGLDLAAKHGIPTAIVDHRAFTNREIFDAALIKTIEEAIGEPSIVVLAGFMRVLTPVFINRFAAKLINIHPALLPDFQGLHTHQRAIDTGVKEHGCTVHFVDSGVDTGAIIAQCAVAVLPQDDENSLSARVLHAEHQLLPWVVERFLAGDFSLTKDLRVLWHRPSAQVMPALQTPLLKWVERQELAHNPQHLCLILPNT